MEQGTLQLTPIGGYNYYSHYTDEKAEAQRWKGAWLRPPAFK